MNSLAYNNLLGQKFFGRTTGLWGENTGALRLVSRAKERRLLEDIADVYKDSAMPTGTVPVPTKKKIRPSSATANLQTHPTYTSGLYDDHSRGRPATAAPTSTGLPQRPKTQAGGPRFWGHKETQTEAQEERKHHRRLTIGPTDGIGSNDQVTRHGPVGISVNQLLKGKVCIPVHVCRLLHYIPFHSISLLFIITLSSFSRIIKYNSPLIILAWLSAN